MDTTAIARAIRAGPASRATIVTRRSVLGHVGPNMLRHSEQSIATLDGLDAGPAWKWRLMTALADYTTGFAIREKRERDAARTGENEQVRPYLKDLAAGLPHLAAMLAAEPEADDNFERGLRWLLDGFQHER